MIVFHEGLPGAGKSYEACIFHILEALKKGRSVITNIEGINHAKFAEISGIPLRFIEQTLKCIDFAGELDDEKRLELQRQAFVAESENDSLVVIDEIQDLWPSNRQKMDPTEQKFFTEHRHKGLDIICMGQDRRDCHNIIRRRLKRVIVFVQLTALGKNDSYQWTAFEATKPEVYKRISSGLRKYEKRYFGLYKSHTSGTKNTEVYNDDRINIFKTFYFRFGLPAFIIFVGVALWNLFGFFTPDASLKQEEALVASSEVTLQAEKKPLFGKEAPKQALPDLSAPVVAEEVKKPEREFMDVFDKDINKYRPRLAAVVVTEKKLIAQIEMLDGSYHRRDVYDVPAVRALGWEVAYNAAGLVVTKGDQKHLIRPWPVDPWGDVSNHVKAQL